jgi:peptidoglycan/LPS O-acetylase OafA/YrhL
VIFRHGMAQAPTTPTSKLNLDSGKRNVGIDLVRAVAIGVVLGVHFFRFTRAQVVSGPTIQHFIARCFGHGYYGVTIFFVVSGFLIANSSFERLSATGLCVRAFPFYLRRATRILPLLWLSVLLGAVALAAIPRGAFGFEEIFAEKGAIFDPAFWGSILTFGFNWERIAVYAPTGDGGWGLHWDVLWSLAVEEQFYLTFPVITVLLGTVGRLRAIMGTIVLCTMLWRAYLLVHGAGWLNAFIGTFTCIDALALGVLAALMPPWGQKVSRIAGVVGVLGLMITYLVDYDVVYGLATTGVAATTMLVIQSTRSLTFKVRPPVALLARFGQLSYGLYLLHPIALFAIAPVVFWLPPAFAFLLFLVASFGLAMISAAFFERPIELGIRSAVFRRGQS